MAVISQATFLMPFSYNEYLTFILISLKSVPIGLINNETTWHRTIIWTNDGLVYWRIYAALIR